MRARVAVLIFLLCLSVGVSFTLVFSQQGIPAPAASPYTLGGEDPRTVDKDIAQRAVNMLADQLPEDVQEKFKNCVKRPIEAAKDGKVDTRALGEALANCLISLSLLGDAAQVVSKVATCQEIAGSLATAFLWHAAFDQPPRIRGGILPETGKVVFKRGDTGEEFTSPEIAYTYDQAHTLYYYEVEDRVLEHKFVPFRVDQLVLPIGWREIPPPPNLVIQACILNINQVHYTDYFYVSVLGQILHRYRPPSAPFTVGGGWGWYREFTRDLELTLPLVIFQGGSLIRPYDIELLLVNHQLLGGGQERSSNDDWFNRCSRIVHADLEHSALQLVGDYKQFYGLKLEPREAFTRGGDASPWLPPSPAPRGGCFGEAEGGPELWYEEGSDIHLKALEQFDGRAFTQWEITMLDFTYDPPKRQHFTLPNREVHLEALGPVIARAWFGTTTVTLDSNLCTLLGQMCQEQDVADLELFKFDGQPIKVKDIPKTLEVGIGTAHDLSVSPAVESYLREMKGLKIEFEGWDDNGDGKVDVTNRNRSITVTAPTTYKALFRLTGPAVALKLRAICGPGTPLSGQELTVRVRVTPPGSELNTPIDYPYAQGTVVEAQALDLQLVACHQFGAPIPVFFSHWEINGQAQPTGRTKVTLTLTRDTTARAIYTMTRCAMLETNKKEYQTGEPVTIRFINGCQATLTLRNSAPWVIKDSQGRVVFTPFSLPVITEVKQGETKIWAWDQKDNNGRQVPAGAYTVELETMDAGTYTARFEIKALAQAKLSVRANCDNARIKVTPPGITVTGPKFGSFTYPQGATVELEALDRQLNSCGMLQVQSMFKHWEVQVGTSKTTLTTAKIQVVLNQDTTATAIYESTQQIITISKACKDALEVVQDKLPPGRCWNWYMTHTYDLGQRYELITVTGATIAGPSEQKGKKFIWQLRLSEDGQKWFTDPKWVIEAEVGQKKSFSIDLTTQGKGRIARYVQIFAGPGIGKDQACVSKNGCVDWSEIQVSARR